MSLFTKILLSEDEGFTLIEILMSISITTLIFSIIFGIFFNITAGKKRGEALGERYQAIRTVLSIMEHDIESATIFQYNDKSIFLGEDREEGGTPMDKLTLTTLASNSFKSVMDGKDENYVEYYPLFDRDTETIILYRRETSLFEQGLEEKREQDSIDLGIRLMAINFRYRDNLGTWVDQWDTADRSGKLPKAIEIQLTLAGEIEAKEPFTAIAIIGQEQQ